MIAEQEETRLEIAKMTTDFNKKAKDIESIYKSKVHNQNTRIAELSDLEDTLMNQIDELSKEKDTQLTRKDEKINELELENEHQVKLKKALEERVKELEKNQNFSSQHLSEIERLKKTVTETEELYKTKLSTLENYLSEMNGQVKFLNLQNNQVNQENQRLQSELIGKQMTKGYEQVDEDKLNATQAAKEKLKNSLIGTFSINQVINQDKYTALIANNKSNLEKKINEKSVIQKAALAEFIKNNINKALADSYKPGGKESKIEINLLNFNLEKYISLQENPKNDTIAIAMLTNPSLMTEKLSNGYIAITNIHNLVEDLMSGIIPDNS
jgi:flagellar capping protein FliD